MVEEASSAGPVREGERVQELDVLRGIALFGVLSVNFVGIAGAGIVATEAQLAALPTAPVDRAVTFAVEWLMGDKANTMFATLFGLGFYLQMERGRAKPGFAARYSRRLFWLLVFGWLNIVFLWAWDILNLYALAGFLLLTMRKWRTRSFVILGVVLAFFNDRTSDALVALAGFRPLVPDALFSDAAALERQAAVIGGDYVTLVATFWDYTYAEWLAGGVMLAWVLYVLGRFAFGAAIGRSGILRDIPSFLPLLRKVAWGTLPAGLALALAARVLEGGMITDDESWQKVGGILRSPAALVLAAGYASVIVLAWHGRRGRRLLAPFAPVGRMALTNYLAQGFAYWFVLFGIGPGLGLAGRIGSAGVFAICFVFFAAQMVFSSWWLARNRFGPMEWLWRWLTYGGAMPPLRRERAEGALA